MQLLELKGIAIFAEQLAVSLEKPMFLECADRAVNHIKTEKGVFVAASRDWLASVAARKLAPVKEALDRVACYP